MLHVRSADAGGEFWAQGEHVLLVPFLFAASHREEFLLHDVGDQVPDRRHIGVGWVARAEREDDAVSSFPVALGEADQLVAVRDEEFLRRRAAVRAAHHCLDGASRPAEVKKKYSIILEVLRMYQNIY